MPYRDPETLRAVLKVIDEFEYDHSERRFQGDCCQQPAQAFSFFPSLQALPTFSPTRQ